jgi:flagellar biosynthesis protein FlhB
MAETAGRTERPTPRRREEARKEGRVVLSPEVSPVAVLLAALSLAWWAAPLLLDQSRVVLRTWLAAAGPAASGDAAIAPMAARSLLEVGRLLGFFFLATGVAGAAAVMAQVGWAPNANAIRPDLGRLSPACGARRILSASGAASLVKAILKMAVVLGVGWCVLRRLGADAAATPAMAPAAVLGFAGTALRRLLLTMALALAALGALDWLWQRWRHEQGLRMTRHEVREEQRETDGDPHVRARFRRLGRRQAIAHVTRADVVLTDATDVAMALRYRAAEAAAPRVVAKGAGSLARRIEDAARAAAVPIVERPTIVRALFRSVGPGALVPPALHHAVAEVLAHVYSRRAIAARGGA